MADALRAMAISGAIMLVVVLVVIAVSFVAVRRGEAAMEADQKHHGHAAH